MLIPNSGYLKYYEHLGIKSDIWIETYNQYLMVRERRKTIREMN